MQQYKSLTPEQVDEFLERGYITIKGAFTREASASFTQEVWMRLGMDPKDKTTWTQERIHMPDGKRIAVSEFAPKAWGAICDLVGGEDRIGEKGHTWGDSFIVNLGTDALEGKEQLPHRDLDNWHVDGDFFVHFMDSPEQALLVIPIFTDIAPRGGGTIICPEGVDLIARYLSEHPEGVTAQDRTFIPTDSAAKYTDPRSDPGFWSHLDKVKSEQGLSFVELTGEVGDVVLMHPFMLHSASKNHLRVPRIITNPPVDLKEPFQYARSNPEDYSLVERKTLRALGKDSFDFKIQGERRLVVPKRVLIQMKMREEEAKRRAAFEGTPSVAVTA